MAGSGGRRTLLVALYVAVVLLLDTLSLHGIGPFAMLHWQSPTGFDVFKFVAWFVIPFALCLWGMDWGALGVRRWRKKDGMLLAGLVAVSLCAVLSVGAFPSLRAEFSGLGGAPWAEKQRYALWFLAWTASWLPGWEFLHRYFLLRPFHERWPRFGWLIVPLSEGLYHLQRPWPMAVGMVLFSLVVTPWCLKRKNILLPFLAHLWVELALLGFMLMG